MGPRGLSDLDRRVTDPKVVALKIAELNGRYGIQTLAYDRWRIGDLKRELDAIGCAVQLAPHGQGFRDMTSAVDILERLVIQRRIRHGNHPVLAMNAASAVVTRDAAGGRKLDKTKSKGRIDGAGRFGDGVLDRDDQAGAGDRRECFNRLMVSTVNPTESRAELIRGLTPNV